MSTATTSTDNSEAVAAAFANRDDQPTRVALDVRGELPSWLSGQLLRNGPGRWKFDNAEVQHWFDGMALLHSFEIADGRVHYMNRFVESRAYRAFRDSGELKFSEFASDPCRTRFQRIQSVFRPQLTDNPAINAFKLGDQYVALSETPMAWEFDPATLETLGVAFQNPDTFATAHPHAGGGELINLSCKLGARSSQSFFAMAPGSHATRLIAKLARRRPTYQHSFGMTDRWLIFTEFPFRVDPLDLLRSGRPFIENFEFHPEDETRITIIDRQTGEIGGEWKAEAGFCFHHVNAWEDGDDVVFDLCRFDDVAIIDDLYLEQINNHEWQPADSSLPYLHRYRLTPGEPRAVEHRVSDQPFDLPRINYQRHNGRAYRFAYGSTIGASGPFESLVKVDVESGNALRWHEPNQLAGEPVFVADPAGTAEDDGVLLSLVLDGNAGRSMLLVLDARDMTELARAEIDGAVAPGLHGNFSSTLPARARA